MKGVRIFRVSAKGLGFLYYEARNVETGEAVKRMQCARALEKWSRRHGFEVLPKETQNAD